jgi:predicted nucleic acid-binding protein
MIFVDTNVIMYAVGGEHPLRAKARNFFRGALKDGTPLATSAEVMQELLHAYVPVERWAVLDDALALVESRISTVWPVEADDVRLARTLTGTHGALGARDLLHLACCVRREVALVKTFDRRLAAAFRG